MSLRKVPARIRQRRRIQIRVPKLLLCPFHACFGDVKSRRASLQIICNSIFALDADHSPHTQRDQERKDQQRSEQNHSLLAAKLSENHATPLVAQLDTGSELGRNAAADFRVGMFELDRERNPHPPDRLRRGSLAEICARGIEISKKPARSGGL